MSPQRQQARAKKASSNVSQTRGGRGVAKEKKRGRSAKVLKSTSMGFQIVASESQRGAKNSRTTVVLPHMERHVTVRRQEILEVVARLEAGGTGGTVVNIGSSMGGIVSALSGVSPAFFRCTHRNNLKICKLAYRHHHQFYSSPFADGTYCPECKHRSLEPA